MNLAGALSARGPGRLYEQGQRAHAFYPRDSAAAHTVTPPSTRRATCAVGHGWR